MYNHHFKFLVAAITPWAQAGKNGAPWTLQLSAAASVQSQRQHYGRSNLKTQAIKHYYYK